MRLPLAVLLLCVTLALTACGKHQPAGERAAARSPGAPTAPARPAATAPQTAAQPSPLARQNPDGSETVEDATGDNGAHNALLAAVASTVAAATSTAAADTPLNGPTLWQDGVHYTRIVPAQPTSVASGQVEVLEFFWYACPHCYAIDPLLETWKKTKPAYVSFSRVPVTWSEGHRALARLFYTLDSLGKLDQLHAEVFKAIQVDGNPLVARDPNDEAENERIQTAFAKKFGVPEAAFKTAYHSFAVDNDLLKADQAVLRYRIDAVPTFVVNGKYVTDVHLAGSPERVISLIDDLAAQEHKR
jgi:protein dithiol oxidoreductase (disulfide-forming)